MARKGSRASAIAKRNDSLLEEIESAQLAEVRRLANAHTEEAVRALVEVASCLKREMSPNENSYFPVALDDDGNRVERNYTASARVAAARGILEYAHGKPLTQGGGPNAPGTGSIKVVIHQYGNGRSFQEIDITPTRDALESGDPST